MTRFLGRRRSNFDLHVLPSKSSNPSIIHPSSNAYGGFSEESGGGGLCSGDAFVCTREPISEATGEPDCGRPGKGEAGRFNRGGGVWGEVPRFIRGTTGLRRGELPGLV